MSTSLTDFASPEVVRALGWTLVHTLWQGAAVAGLLAVALRLTRAGRAATRYVLSAAALVLVPALAVGTFGWLYEPAASAAAPRLTVLTVAADPAPLSARTMALSIAPTLTWAERAELAARLAADRLEPWLPVLVLTWAVGLGLMLVRLGGGLLMVRRLRRVGVVPAPTAWQARAEALGTRLGVSRAVRLLESATVAGPVAVGWLRPAVLLPVGLLAGLPAAQLDAILAHELAHIRRHDYVLNLVQAVIEAVFFFHPAVWWMSARVRQEREHCCDDLAVRALGGDARPLARALAALAAWSAPAPTTPVALPRLTLAATGGALLTRVRRLLVPTPEAAARPGGGALAGSGAVALALLLTLTLNAVARGPQTAPQANPPASPAASTEPLQGAGVGDSSKKRRIERRIELRSADRALPPGGGRNLIIVKDKKNRLREVYVDGKKVPKEKLDEFRPLVEERLSETERTRREGLETRDADRRQAIEEAYRDFADAERRTALDREWRRLSRADRRAARDAERRAKAEARNADREHREEREERDIRIFLNGPRAEVNGRVIRLDSLERDLNDKIERAFSDVDFGNFHFSISDDDDDADADKNIIIERVAPPPPVPPVPPTPGNNAVPPVPPAPPAPPAAPRAPKAGADAKTQQRYRRQMQAYDKKMAAYGDQMRAYGKQMEAYGKQMEEYGRLQARANSAAPGGRAWKRGESWQLGGNGRWYRDESADDKREAADEARRSANEAHRDALRSAAEARREAAEARREAMREIERTRRDRATDPANFEDELRRDGLIGKDAKSYTVDYANGELKIDGKTQPTEVKEKYRKMLNIPANDKETIIRFKASK